MLNKEKMYSIIDIALAEAGDLDTRVIVQGGKESLTRFANSEIHQNVEVTSLSATIIVTRGRKRSQISTDFCAPEGIRAGVREALANLDFLPEGEEEPPLVESPEVIEKVSLDPAMEEEYSRDNRARLVGSCLASLEDGYKAFGALTCSTNLLAVGNSRGIKRFSMGNHVNFTALVASDRGGSGFADARSTRASDLDIPQAFDRSFQKARMNRDPEELEPGPYTVVLEPLAVGDILTYLSYMGFSAKSVQDQASFLTGKLGQKVFGDNITIVDNHLDPNTVSLPFDFEGAPRKQVTIIDKGVARGMTYDLASARKDGVETTGHSVNQPQMGGVPLHLVMAGGDQSLDEIIAGTRDGLLVTRFHYMNPTNPRRAQLTALTRDGLFRLKDGKIAGAVKNLRFTESMLEALSRVEALSKERHRTDFFFLNYYVPALKIKDFHFTGKSS